MLRTALLNHGKKMPGKSERTLTLATHSESPRH